MRICLVCLVVLSVSFGACAAGDTVVAEGAWGKITQLDLDCARQASPPGATDEYLIEQLAKDSLGAMKATGLGLEKEPLARWRMWMVEQGLGGRQLFETQIASSVHVTTEELQKAYQERLPKLVTPGNFSFRYIFCDTTECKSPAEVEAVKAKINEAHKELLSTLGPDPQRPWIVETDRFVQIAEKYSDVKGEPGRIAGPFRFTEPLQSAIKNTVLSLKPFEISPVFSTRYGFEIVRLQEIIQDSTPEFKTIVSSLREELSKAGTMKKAKEFIEALRADKTRYEIYEDRLVLMLPGAHSEVPSTTAVVRIGKTLYSPEQLKEFVETVSRREWVRAKEKKEAVDLVWRAFVLPQLLREEAMKAGFTTSASELIREKREKNSILSAVWLNKESERILASMPKPSSQELQAIYEQDKDKYRVDDRFQMILISYPIEELKKKDFNPAQIEFLYRDGVTHLTGVLGQVTQGASPEALVKATETSEKPLKIETRWLSKGLIFDVDDWEYLATLMPGSWTEKPIRTSSGVCIAKLLQIEPARVRTFDEVSSTIVRKIMSERERVTRDDLNKQLTTEAMSSLKKP